MYLFFSSIPRYEHQPYMHENTPTLFLCCLKMKTEKQNSMKYFPGITMRKPQLRNDSWAKLLSQQRSRKVCENGGKINGLDVWCEPVPLLRLTDTRKTHREPVGNLRTNVRTCKDKNVEKLYETGGKSLDNNEKERCSKDGACSKEEAKETPRTASDQDKTGSHHLPPIGDFNPEPKSAKEPFKFRINSEDQRGSFPCNKIVSIDWQKIFVNGGFRPHESRELPTRGELNLLKYNTWDADDPLYRISKCTKYFGLDSGKDKAGKLTLVEKEPPKFYTSPSPTYKFYQLKAPMHQKASFPLESTQESLMSSKNPSKRYNLCNSCIAPLVTPAPSMMRSSPFIWTPLPYMEKQNNLEKLAELSLDGQTTDEGIGSPTESELDL